MLPHGLGIAGFTYLGPMSKFSRLPSSVLIAGLSILPVRAQHSWIGCPDVKESDFRKVTFIGKPGVDEPVKMAFARDGRFFWIERRGAIKRWDPGTKAVSELIRIPVFLENTRGGMGVTLDPAFESNRFVYAVYAANSSTFRLSRFTLTGDRLLDERTVLDVPFTPGAGAHASGAMAWDNAGNLLWGLGDNSRPTQYAPISNTDMSIDSRRSAASSNSLHGKILRIRPEPAGGYSIPAGNLFAESPGGQSDTGKTRPEIYAMGFRNPWSLAYDRLTGWLLEGEVGPDAMGPGEGQGPAANEEINLVKTPGNYGWPFFAGHNLSYRDGGAAFNPDLPVNESPFNTGIRNLPPARPALLAWSHDGKSPDETRWISMGGRDGTGMVGPIYRYDPGLASTLKLPPHFEGVFFLMDWERSSFLSASLDSSGNVTSVRKPFGAMTFSNPIGAAIGTRDGALYVIEYGTNIMFQSPSTQKISRIEYTGSCLPTEASGTLRSTSAGARPRLRVDLRHGALQWDGRDARGSR